MGEIAIHEGDLAPDFSFNDHKGNKTSLYEMRGRRIVLYFYPKDFTTGCTIEAHNFQTDLPKYDADKAVIVGVSVDTTETEPQPEQKEAAKEKE